jgi:HEAT repeat protein
MDIQGGFNREKEVKMKNKFSVTKSIALVLLCFIISNCSYSFTMLDVKRAEEQQDYKTLFAAVGQASETDRHNVRYSEVVRAAEWALKRINDPRAVEPLIAALEHKNKNVSACAAVALGNIRDPRAVEPLIAALKHKYDDVSEGAARALGNIKDPRAVEPLIAALSYKNDRPPKNLTKTAAARALGKIKDPRAVEPLIAFFKEKYHSRGGYEATAWALGELRDPRAVPILCADILVLYTRGGGESATALGKIKDPRTVPVLIEALKYQDKRRSSSAWALQEITGKDFGEDHSKWRMWLEENKGTFR